MPTQSLIDGYRQFREKYKSDHAVFDRLADEGQDPKVMWIGCSDSRVVPELITGADPEELFDLRNIANVVPPATSDACATGAAVEYAVIHLGVDHIVVCGHTECGGIAALAAEPDPDTAPIKNRHLAPSDASSSEVRSGTMPWCFRRRPHIGETDLSGMRFAFLPDVVQEGAPPS